jgi:glycosyltransferase involved in cell wall biosynthesis
VHLGQPEAFGMVLLESFAAGCRLVVLEHTFLDDLPEPARSRGVHRVTELQPQAIARGMREAARNVDFGVGLWECRKQVMSDFAWDAVAGKLGPALSQSIALANSSRVNLL